MRPRGYLNLGYASSLLPPVTLARFSVAHLKRRSSGSHLSQTSRTLASLQGDPPPELDDVRPLAALCNGLHALYDHPSWSFSTGDETAWT